MAWPAETQSRWGPSCKTQTIYLRTVLPGKRQDGMYTTDSHPSLVEGCPWRQELPGISELAYVG